MAGVGRREGDILDEASSAAERRMIMAKNVVCKKCNNLVNDWCEKVIDSPDRDMQRDCQYFCEKTNAQKIRAMSDEELAEFIRSMIDESGSHNVACYGCINYGTHHSDPANKGTYLYECDGCENEGIGLDVLMWLQQPAEKSKEAF